MFVYYKVFQCLFFIMLIFSIQQVVLENLRFDCFILVWQTFRISDRVCGEASASSP